MRQRAVALAVVASLSASVALLAMAMRLYPGGTWCDEATPGHAFWGNFLCDLAWDTSIGGAPNPLGSRIGKAAMTSLALATALFFVLVPALFGGRARWPRAALVVPGLGTLSVVGMIAVAVLPSSEVGDLHAVLVFLSAGPAFVAAFVAVVALARDEPRPRVAAATGAFAIFVSVLDLALYAWHLASRADCAPLVPVVQKVALGLLLAWMATVAGKVLVLTARRSRVRPSTAGQPE
jgi:hypothetical protein